MSSSMATPIEPQTGEGYGAPVSDRPQLNAATTAALKEQLKALIIQCCQIENVTTAQVMDDEARKREFSTSNMYKAWGPAKMSIRRLYDPLLRAKRAGKHILLTAHTKEATEQREDKTVIKLGLKSDTEAMLNDLLDVHLRMFVDLKRDDRWFETVKCRPQREFKPLLPARIDIPRHESHLMYGRLLAMIGETPESAAIGDAENEDLAALDAMKAAGSAARR